MPLDATTVGTGLGALVACLTGAVLWFRNNKVSDAKADASVAANYADTVSWHGQAEEIKSLRERVTKLDTAYVAMASRVALLEAAVLGASSHLDNIILCDKCSESNKVMLSALAATLARAARESSDAES